MFVDRYVAIEHFVVSNIPRKINKIIIRLSFYWKITVFIDSEMQAWDCVLGDSYHYLLASPFHQQQARLNGNI